MLRTTARGIGNLLRRTLPNYMTPANAALGRVRQSSGEEESDECFQQRMEDILSREDMDGWDLRQAFNNIAGTDMFVDACLVELGLKACRRLNDIALAIRWLETCREKCADYEKTMWPHIMCEVCPTMKELGIPTLEELCYHKPELALQSVFDMWT